MSFSSTPRPPIDALRHNSQHQDTFGLRGSFSERNADTATSDIHDPLPSLRTGSFAKKKRPPSLRLSPDALVQDEERGDVEQIAPPLRFGVHATTTGSPTLTAPSVTASSKRLGQPDEGGATECKDDIGKGKVLAEHRSFHFVGTVNSTLPQTTSKIMGGAHKQQKQNVQSRTMYQSFLLDREVHYLTMWKSRTSVLLCFFVILGGVWGVRMCLESSKNIGVVAGFIGTVAVLLVSLIAMGNWVVDANVDSHPVRHRCCNPVTTEEWKIRHWRRRLLFWLPNVLWAIVALVPAALGAKIDTLSAFNGVECLVGAVTCAFIGYTLGQIMVSEAVWVAMVVVSSFQCDGSGLNASPGFEGMDWLDQASLPLILCAISLFCAQFFMSRWLTSKSWERFVDERRFKIEAMRVEELLTLLMPRKIAHELLAGSSFSQTLNKVAIVFIYVESYRERACGSDDPYETLEPTSVLHQFYKDLDCLILDHDYLYKIENIENTYLLAAGVLQELTGKSQPLANYVEQAIQFSWEAMRLAGGSGSTLRLKVGIASGPACAAIIGSSRSFFRLFGDTVNTASRMGITCPSDSIQLCPFTYRALRKNAKLLSTMITTRRRVLMVKGKGKMELHLVTSVEPEPYRRANVFSNRPSTSSMLTNARLLQEISSNILQVDRKTAITMYKTLQDPLVSFNEAYVLKLEQAYLRRFNIQKTESSSNVSLVDVKKLSPHNSEQTLFTARSRKLPESVYSDSPDSFEQNSVGTHSFSVPKDSRTSDTVHPVLGRRYENIDRVRRVLLNQGVPTTASVVDAVNDSEAIFSMESPPRVRPFPSKGRFPLTPGARRPHTSAGVKTSRTFSVEERKKTNSPNLFITPNLENVKNAYHKRDRRFSYTSRIINMSSPGNSRDGDPSVVSFPDSTGSTSVRQPWKTRCRCFRRRRRHTRRFSSAMSDNKASENPDDAVKECGVFACFHSPGARYSMVVRAPIAGLHLRGCCRPIARFRSEVLEYGNLRYHSSSVFLKYRIMTFFLIFSQALICLITASVQDVSAAGLGIMVALLLVTILPFLLVIHDTKATQGVPFLPKAKKRSEKSSRRRSSVITGKKGNASGIVKLLEDLQGPHVGMQVEMPEEWVAECPGASPGPTRLNISPRLTQTRSWRSPKLGPREPNLNTLEAAGLRSPRGSRTLGMPHADGRYKQDHGLSDGPWAARVSLGSWLRIWTTAEVLVGSVLVANILLCLALGYSIDLGHGYSGVAYATTMALQLPAIMTLGILRLQYGIIILVGLLLFPVWIVPMWSYLVVDSSPLFIVGERTVLYASMAFVMVNSYYGEQTSRDRVVRRLAAVNAQHQGDSLLTQLLPDNVVNLLKRNQEMPFQVHERPVGILWADLAGFTKLCSEFKDPQFAKQLIATLYGHFDENADRLGLWKMDTIGDAYIVVGGLFDHVHEDSNIGKVIERLFALASEMQLFMDGVRNVAPELGSLKLRIGINAGEVVKGVLGHLRPRFHVFGKALADAEAMESSCVGGSIQVSQAAAECYKDRTWTLHEREEDGVLQSYWLDPKESGWE